jgi:PEP-CTERM motif
MFLKTLKSKIVVLGALLAGSIGTAQAIPQSQTWIDFEGDFGTYIDGKYQYTHDITDGWNGFRPGIDTLTSATLSIWLYDDQGFLGIDHWLAGGDSQESVKFKFDGGGWSSSGNVELLSDFWFDVTSLLDDGLLSVVVKAVSGDFRFATSILKVHGDTGTSVPEPATLTLFGFGLLAVGFAARRKRAQ